jgi:polyisoprenoid-binding protein YceI
MTSQMPPAGAYTIDPGHTEVTFVARHLMVTKVRGRFTDVVGTIVVADRPEDSSVEAEIKAASLTTGSPDRDGHVKSPDFLDVDNHPLITFRSTGLRGSGDAWKLEGELTVRGTVRPVTLDLTYEGGEKDPWGGDRVAFSARTEVNREDWGLVWNVALDSGGVLVSKNVKLELDVQAVRQA